MEIIYINSVEDLKKYYDNNKLKILPKDKELKIVIDGTIESDEFQRIAWGFCCSLHDKGYDFSIDIKLNSNIKKDIIYRDNLISKTVGYFIDSLPPSFNIFIDCFFQKDDEQIFIESRYFARDMDGQFLDNLKDKIDAEKFNKFIERIKDNNYSERIKCENIKDLDTVFEKIVNVDGKVQLFINLETKDYNDEFLYKILNIINQARTHNKQIDIVIDAKNMNIPTHVVKTMMENKDFNEYSGVNVFYSGEFEDYYSAEELLSATAKAKLFVNQIKNLKDASPFEKYMMIYKYVANHVYKLNEETNGKSRDLISVLNGDDIVCAGYANLLKWLCNEVGIECETQDVVVDKSLHRNNRVYIKDEKYGIDGWYFVDSTWDAISKRPFKDITYNYCLVPISDVKYIVNDVSFLNASLLGEQKGLGLLYNNYEEFIDISNLKNTMGSNGVCDWARKIFNPSFNGQNNSGNKKQYTDEDKQKAHDQVFYAIDVIENIMKKNSFGEYLLDEPTGGIEKLVLLYVSGSLDEQGIEMLLKATEKKLGAELKSKHISSNESSKKTNIRNFDQTTYVRTLSFYDEIDELNEQLAVLESENADEEELFKIRIKIDKKRKQIKEYEISRQEEREKYIKSLDEYKGVNKEKVFKLLEEFMLEMCDDWKSANEKFLQIRNNSNSIEFEKFYNAIVRSYMFEGYSEQEARAKADYEISETVRRSESCYEEEASNCFMKNSPIGRVFEGNGYD